MVEYNGWNSKETWNVWIHIQNDYDTYLYYKEYLERIINTGDTRSELIASLENVIERDHNDKAKRLDGVLLDLITYSLSKVDWNEIAESMVDNALKPMNRIKLKGFNE
jgi:hypothetical protein